MNMMLQSSSPFDGHETSKFLEEYIQCSCWSHEHSFFMSYDDEDNHIYLSVQLNAYEFNWRDFFRRFKNAFLYLINKEREYGDFDATIIRWHDYQKLIDFLSNIKKVGNPVVSGLNYCDIDSCVNTTRFVVSKDERNSKSKDEWERELPKDFCVFTFLKKEKSFFKRIYKGLRYIFGYRSNFGMYDECTIEYNDAVKIQLLAQEATESALKWIAYNEKTGRKVLC